MILNAGDVAMRDSVRSYVIHQLTRDKDCTYEASISMSYVLCMAKVLISACQKIPDSSKRPFTREIHHHLIQSVEVCHNKGHNCRDRVVPTFNI